MSNWIKFAGFSWRDFTTCSGKLVLHQPIGFDMLGRSGVMISLILVCCAAGQSQSLADDGCSLKVVETNAAQAVQNCTSILNVDEITTASRAEALKIRGRALKKMGRLDDAISDYEAALQIAPDDPELHLRRGWTAFDKHDLDLAFDHARRALELKPADAEAYDLIGAAFALGGPEKFQQAKAAYDEAVRLASNDPHVRFNRLMLLEANNFFHEALQEADAILQLPAPLITKPEATTSSLRRTTFRIATAMERADLLRVTGRINEAMEAYDRAVELDPDALTYTWRAAFRLAGIGIAPGVPIPPTNAIQDDLDKAIALDPDYWFSRDQQANLYFFHEQFDLAAPEFVRALKLYPINGAMRWKYALALRELGRGEEAAAEAITAFRLDPGFMVNKLGALRKRGYLAAIAPDADPRPALIDAVRACMLDEGCG
jgi:tetratricopeptide (TPR) repeat protein